MRTLSPLQSDGHAPSDEQRSDEPSVAVRRERGLRLAAAVAGPALITVAAVAPLWTILVSARIPQPHIDILPFWLPVHCFLGRSLAAGHVPAWNPHVMGGLPFAADPQSGWMYLPAMLLYGTLPCSFALRMFIGLQPLLAGFGLYAFFRTEGVSRSAATAGAVALTLAISAYHPLATELPFAGALAWSAVTLVAAARLLRAQTWSGRLAWTVAVALSWGQIAAAHLSNGLVLGTLALALYAICKLVADVRSGRRSARLVLAQAGLLTVSLPLVNLAFLLPRIAYLSRSTIGDGFVALSARAEQLSGHAARIVWGNGIDPTWPLSLARPPGQYLGAAVTLLAVAAWRQRRFRALAIAFGIFGTLCYVASLHGVAQLLPNSLDSTIASFYVHSPNRFTYGLLLAMPALAALGVEALREASSNRQRVEALGPGLVVWGVLPVVYLGKGGWPTFVAGALAVAAAVAFAGRRSVALAVVPPIVFAEIIVGSWLDTQFVREKAAADRSVMTLGNTQAATVDLARYQTPGRIARTLERGPDVRYASLIPRGPANERGYLLLQSPPYWPLLTNQRSMLFGLEGVNGYNPVQVQRFWSFVRASEHKKITYNQAFFTNPPRVVLDLLQIGWVVSRTDQAPPAPAEPAAREGRWQLYRLPNTPPRASLVSKWVAVPDADAALREVVGTSFDPREVVVVEGSRGGSGGANGSRGSAFYRQIAPESAEVVTESRRPAVLLVRNVFDRYWRATVDGRAASVFPADYVAQGVRVPPGRHVVRLLYRDPTIGLGAAGSALALALFLGPAAWLARRQRADRKRARSSSSDIEDRSEPSSRA